MKSQHKFALLLLGLALAATDLLHPSTTPAQEVATSGDSFSIASVLRHKDGLNEAHDVELLGNHAFVAGKGGSIAVLILKTPERPQLLWYRRDRDELADSETVLPAPGRLFLGTNDFHSLDISNPRHPKFDATLSERPGINTINGMVRRNHTIFAANKQGFVCAIDVSDESHPRFIGAIPVRKRDGLTSPHDLDLFGPYLVVVDPNGFGRKPGSLALYRVYDETGELLAPSSWKQTGRVSGDVLKGANRVQVRGEYAFVAGSISPRIGEGRTLAKGIVVELSDPERPNVVASVDFPDVRGPNGLTIAGDVWFLAGGQTVQAYDISRPEQPRLLTSFTSADAFPTADDNAHDLVYRNGYLYVTSQGDHGLVTLKVVDEQIRSLAESLHRPGEQE